MDRDVILNFLTKDTHLQKETIDYDKLFYLAEHSQTDVKDLNLTPKNQEKVVRKLEYLSDIDCNVTADFHIIDLYSINLLRSKFGLQTKLKNKILYEDKIYRFIFEYYFYKHNIDYDQFVNIDTDLQLLAENLDINIQMILEKNTNTLEELSKKYNCTRESIRLRIKDTKKFVRARFPLPNKMYVLESNISNLDTIEQIVLLSFHDEIWNDQFKAYILSDSLVKKVKKFEIEVAKLKHNYTYPIMPIDSSIYALVTSFVQNDPNLYLDDKQLFSLLRESEHHNANYILNYLKVENVDQFYIEDLLHDKFLNTVHGQLMGDSITTSLRNLEAILDREEQLVKIDTHFYKLESSIKNINFIDLNDIFYTLRKMPEDIVDLDLLETTFSSQIKMLDIPSTGFYYLLKKHFNDKFQFRKLVIYSNDYKLQTKFELLAEEFHDNKVTNLDESLLTNATNLSRKFKEMGGLIYGDKLYNIKKLNLTKIFEEIIIEPDFDGVIYRSTFNDRIDDIILEEIDFKRKFAFKLWAYIHNYEYFNFYLRRDDKYPELNSLVYAINGKKNKIKYKRFIDIIEKISGSRKVYQILQNMIDSKIVDAIEVDEEKVILFKNNTYNKDDLKQLNSRPNSLTVDSRLEDMNMIELRNLAKKVHIKNINKYKKDELISILKNTVKIKVKKKRNK